MDWAGWALFGLVATAALTAVMIMAQLAGLTRLDLPLLLGTIVTEDPDRARVAGFLLHLVIGQGFALGYAASFSLLDRATWWLGGLLGLLHGVVSLTVLVPLLEGVHPPLATHRAGSPGPSPARCPAQGSPGAMPPASRCWTGPPGGWAGCSGCSMSWSPSPCSSLSLRACTRAWRRTGPVDRRPRCWSRPGWVAS